MANITLTAQDVADLLEGATINALADDGSEHILDGEDLTGTQIEMLENGQFIELDNHNCTPE